MEITMSAADKKVIEDAAQKAQLRPITWARAQLLLAAIRALKEE